jgi:drug/metabolite transporter (DMT)-like permease
MARGILLLLFCNIVGGMTYPWMKEATAGLPPITVTLLRCLVALPLLTAWLASRGELRWGWDRRETARLAILGLAGFAVPLTLGTVGMVTSTATNGAILILLEPVSILLFARILLGEHVGGRRAVGVALGFAGALCVVTGGAAPGDPAAGDAASAGGGALLGNLILAASAILWGLYSPLAIPLVRKRSGAEIGFAVMLFALALLIPAALTESDRWHSGPHLRSALIHTALLGVLASFLGTILWTTSLRHVPPAVVASMVLLQPAVGTFVGVVQHGEHVTRQAALGAALAAVGVLVVVLAGNREAAPPVAS